MLQNAAGMQQNNSNSWLISNLTDWFHFVHQLWFLTHQSWLCSATHSLLPTLPVKTYKKLVRNRNNLIAANFSIEFRKRQNTFFMTIFEYNLITIIMSLKKLIILRVTARAIVNMFCFKCTWYKFPKSFRWHPWHLANTIS